MAPAATAIRAAKNEFAAALEPVGKRFDLRFKALDLVVRVDVVSADVSHRRSIHRASFSPEGRIYSAATRVAGSIASTRAAQNLNSGIFAERIELRIGEQVGRRLGEGERDEHHAVGHGVVLARGFSSTVPRRVATRIMSPGLMPSLRDGAARDVRHRRRLDRIEHRRAPRHRAGVPMFELAAGGEHERIIVHPAPRRAACIFAATSLAQPPGRGKPLSNTMSWPGLSGASAG